MTEEGFFQSIHDLIDDLSAFGVDEAVTLARPLYRNWEILAAHRRKEARTTLFLVNSLALAVGSAFSEEAGKAMADFAARLSAAARMQQAPEAPSVSTQGMSPSILTGHS